MRTDNAQASWHSHPKNRKWWLAPFRKRWLAPFLCLFFPRNSVISAQSTGFIATTKRGERQKANHRRHARHGGHSLLD